MKKRLFVLKFSVTKQPIWETVISEEKMANNSIKKKSIPGWLQRKLQRCIALGHEKNPTRQIVGQYLKLWVGKKYKIGQGGRDLLFVTRETFKVHGMRNRRQLGIKLIRNKYVQQGGSFWDVSFYVVRPRSNGTERTKICCCSCSCCTH